jgi:hypothetical protein
MPAGKVSSETNAGNLTREDATINAEIRCYAEFQAPDSCTRLPRCTDLPRYLELRFGHMRIISSIYVRLGMWRYAIHCRKPSSTRCGRASDRPDCGHPGGVAPCAAVPQRASPRADSGRPGSVPRGLACDGHAAARQTRMAAGRARPTGPGRAYSARRAGPSRRRTGRGGELCPLRPDGTRYATYAEAMADLSRPKLFENRICYRLLDAAADRGCA